MEEMLWLRRQKRRKKLTPHGQNAPVLHAEEEQK
jgi:hypothetical protein